MKSPPGTVSPQYRSVGGTTQGPSGLDKRWFAVASNRREPDRLQIATDAFYLADATLIEVEVTENPFVTLPEDVNDSLGFVLRLSQRLHTGAVSLDAPPLRRGGSRSLSTLGKRRFWRAFLDNQRDPPRLEGGVS